MSRTTKHAPASSSGLGGMFRSITKTLKGGLSQASPTQVQPTIVGGASDLQDLLERVKSSNTVSERIQAAEKIQKSIETFSVSSIPEIWYSVDDMVSSSFSPQCRRAGIQLMISCIQRDENSHGSRMSYYNSIIDNSNLQDFDLQLKAFKELSNNGTNLRDFFLSQSRIPKVLSSWFQRLASECQDIRIGLKNDLAEAWGTSMEENFHSFLQFLTEIFRYNHSLFNKVEISVLVKEATSTCRTTNSEYDVQYCLAFIDVVLSYAFVPIENLPALLEVLCAVAGLPSRAEQAWSLVIKLSKSYISNNTFAGLYSILETTEGEINYNTMRGAAVYLQRLTLFYVEQKRDAEISIVRVMNAYNLSLASDSMRHKYEICCCIYNLLKDEKTRNKFTYDICESKDYSPLEIIYRISKNPLIHSAASHATTSENEKEKDDPEKPSLSVTNSDLIKSITMKFQEIFALLGAIYDSNTFLGPKYVVVDYFVDMSPFIDESSALIVVNYFREAHYCNPLSRNWIRNTDELLKRFFRDSSRGTAVRQRVLDVTNDIFELAQEICEPSDVFDLIDKVFYNVEGEVDNSIFQSLLHMFEEISKSSSISVLNHISAIFLRFFPDVKDKTSSNSVETGATSVTLVPTTNSEMTYSVGCRKQMVVAAFCKIFFGTFRSSAVKAHSVYHSLLTICERSLDDPISYVEAARVLCRLRASANNYIFVTTPVNMDGLSASLGRNLTGVSDTSVYKAEMSWWYPETIPYLNEEDLEVPSYVLKTHIEDISNTKAQEYEIDISLWFNEILRVIEHGAHWEIYSFIWAHFGPQLANVQLFYRSGCDIQKLRIVICDQILHSSKSPEISFPKDVSRNDIKVTLIRTTSSLLSYHDQFSKRDEDYIVMAFVEGLSASEKAVVPCIHGLVVSCYELPLSIKKFLGQIFIKFQTKITNSSTSPHILEFLLSLSRLPSLTDNFTQDEYKRVFGMAIKYIQYAYDLAQKEQGPEAKVNSAKPGIGIIRNTIDSSNNKILSQYLLVLAYNVIATWFLTLRLSERKYMAKFIIRNLILAEGTPDTIDTQSLAYVDLISRFTYSNLDLTVQTTMAPTTQSNSIVKQWIYGTSIVSIATDPQIGDSQVTIRRPTGTSAFNLRIDEKMIPAWLEEHYLKLRKKKDEDSISLRLGTELHENFTPNHFLLQLMIPIDTQQSVKPLAIPNDPATIRAIGAFDRTPVVDFHKVGVLYVGPGQREELEILGNSVGSVHYKRFLEGMGRLVRLKDNRKIYAGGLDISSDIDGEYAYVWNDKVTQLIFHTTTMMPAPANPHDVSFASKKRHIGNDFVNIFFDESELPFEFGLVKSQFNFINISITPISCTFSRSASFIDQINGLSEGKAGESKMFYKVRALCKPGVPAIFAACHLKIVSEESLAVFVRNLAIISSKFATVWNSQGGYISHWQYRLEQINTLREKILAELNKTASGESSTTQNVLQPKPTHQRSESTDKKDDISKSFLDQLSSAPAVAAPEKQSDKLSNGNNSGVPAFSMDEPDEQDSDLPLLRTLDFSHFT